MPYEFNEYIDARDSGLLDHIKNSRNIVTNAVLHCNKKMKQNLSYEEIHEVIIDRSRKEFMKEIGVSDYEMILGLIKLNEVRKSHGFQNKSFVEDMKFCHEVLLTKN